MTNLSDALQQEINRCIDVIAIYRSLPIGDIAASFIEQDVHRAIKALAEGDVERMIVSLQILKDVSL
jgi:hypothetical protein